MDILGYLLALLIGLSLGLIGGGGSILTVPVLVYVLGFGVVLSTAYSLFIVGIVALFGAIDKFIKNQVNINTALLFGFPSFLAVYATRRFIVPSIPDELFKVWDFSVTKEIGLMVFFAFIMLLAAFSMLRNSKKVEAEDSVQKSINYPLIIIEGIVVGFVTGLIGAGGGFLIVPALVLLVGMPMKEAIGTSLLIIAVKSLLGFVGDLQTGLNVDWAFLLSFSLISVLGILIGGYLSRFISGQSLKKGFAWFILFMAAFILFKELFIL